ncbi:MAG TPA: hypothetical protein P5228_11825 [Bacteroidales bacterium]|nr:hypothetical protein [Bacteroidales bacterium]HRZ49311.1 hypothetical protein [Bacteroidales bacterium]
MKRNWMLALVLILLLPVMSCKKEVPEIAQNKLILSSELWIPGEVYYVDDYCYWIDPDLWQEPVNPEEIIHGELNQKGREETIVVYENGHWVIKKNVICFDTGSECGIMYCPAAGGSYANCGNYMKKN